MALVLALAVALLAGTLPLSARSAPERLPDHAPAHGVRGADASPGDEAPFLVGVAAVPADPIGPDPDDPYAGVCLGGYGSFCTRPMTEVRDPLFARGLAVTGAGGETLVLLTVTAEGLFAAYKDAYGENGTHAIRQGVAERTGVPASNVIVQSDHSHAAPDTIGIWGGVPRWYMDQLAEAAVQAGAEAVAARVPAELSVGVAQGPPLRSLYESPPNNVTDDELRVVFADSPEGERIATLVNYSPHATVLGSSNRGGASGDWPAWAAEEVEDLYGGGGIATIGAIGATDWGKSGSSAEAEAEARQRLRRLITEAEAARVPVAGDEVAVETVFIREALTQPVLLANATPGISAEVSGLAGQKGSLTMERDIRRPWLSGGLVGTYAGAARIGDVFLSAVPGEAFPHLQLRLAEGVEGASAHLMIGAANDFLGYMVESPESYLQAMQKGTLFLAGCPDSPVREGVGLEGGCNDHWTLQVSPVMGQHVLCTVQDAAVDLGFAVSNAASACPMLTALDGQAAPPEHPGG
jgi:hypothetical protein